jgi:hypothetical protein
MTRLCFAGSAGSSAQFSQRPIQEQKNQAAALQRKNSALEVGPLTWQVQLVSSKTWDFWGCFTMFHHVSPEKQRVLDVLFQDRVAGLPTTSGQAKHCRWSW